MNVVNLTDDQVSASVDLYNEGDTLGTVADRYDTTVEALVELNPGVDPTGLQVGQRLRVK